MKKFLFAILILPFSVFGQSQTLAQQSVSGSITIPSLVSLNITHVGDMSLNLRNIQEMELGKQFNNYLKVRVRSNRPWIISVMNDSRYFTKSTGANSSMVPTNIISMMADGGSHYINLDTSPQQLIQSNNNAIENNYFIHVKVGPTLDFHGGQYHTNFIFTITPM